jgi:hypothetical protein
MQLFSADAIMHEKYRGWNGSTVEISCWADLARPLAGIKNSPKNLCSHVIAGGDGINQFLMKIWAFWYIICLFSCSEQKYHQFFIGGSLAVHNKVHQWSVCSITLTSLIKGHARLFFSRKKSSLPSDFHVIDWKFHPTR